MLEVTRELARFISDFEFEDISPEDIGRAKTLMHDFVGIGIRARHEVDSTFVMVRATEILGADGGRRLE